MLAFLWGAVKVIGCIVGVFLFLLFIFAGSTEEEYEDY